MKRVDSGRPKAAQSQGERVTAGADAPSALPPSAPSKEIAQAARRFTALEERVLHLEQQFTLLIEELHGDDDGVPTDVR